MFTADLAEIEALRTSAVASTDPHPSGIKKLQTYAAQLVWMGGKFPIDIGTDFTWYPSLGYDTNTPMSQNNIRFELANVLFNLGALYCQLAIASNRATADGLKSAANYFMLGAGVMSHLKATIMPEMRSTAPTDMDAMTLECLENLLLAQAQECFWQKAVKDGLKDASIAKLASKVSDLYVEASDCGIKSNSISSEWIHHMSVKHHHFAAAAQYRAACDCLEKRKYGEEVARLRDALACANEALKEGRYVDKVVVSDLHGLKNKVQDDLQRAEKDNDLIYLQTVPPRAELKTIDRASMVKAKITPEITEPVAMLSEQGELGRPLFAKLVPYSVHVAASIYASRRDDTVNSIINELEALTQRIHDLMSSLSLPGSLQALEKPLGLPPGLVSHAEEIRQQNGPNRLKRAMEDIDKLKANDRRTYLEGVNLLRTEAAEDAQARVKYGTDRWNRMQSQEAAAQLYGHVKEYEAYFTSAESSDATVRQNGIKQESIIRLLNGTDRELEEFVPSSRRATIAPKLEREVNRLRGALNDTSRLESRRKRKIESLRSKAQADDVSPELLKEASRLEREYPMQKIEAVQFEDFFDRRLQRYESDKAVTEDERREQEKVLSSLAEANTAFVTAKRGDSSSKEREQALQTLENAYFAYKEMIQNLEVGRKFYNDLAPMVAQFRDKCRNFAYDRRSEATQLEADITMTLPMANLSLEAQQQRPTMTTRASSKRAPAREEPLAAPVPMKPQMPTATGPEIATWTPDMGIKFGSLTTPTAPKSNNTFDPSGPLKFR